MPTGVVFSCMFYCALPAGGGAKSYRLSFKVSNKALYLCLYIQCLRVEQRGLQLRATVLTSTNMFVDYYVSLNADSKQFCLFQYFTSRLKDSSLVDSSANQTEASSERRSLLEAKFNNVMTLCSMLPLLLCTCLNSFLHSL